MVAFTQDPNPTSDPSYLGMSQGTDKPKADTSTGDMLENIGKLGGSVVKAAYGIQRDTLYNQIDKKVTDYQNSIGVGTAAEMAAAGIPPTSMKGDATNFLNGTGADSEGGTDTTGAGLRPGRGNPAGIQRFGTKVAGVQTQYDQGLLSDSNYNARLLAITKEVKAAHSGWNEEIDAMVHKITGIQPANALVKSMRADFDAAEKAKTAGNSRDMQFFNTYGHLTSLETRTAILKGDTSPARMAQMRYEVMGRRETEAGLDSLKSAYSVREATGKATKEDLLQVAQASVDHYTNQSMVQVGESVGGMGKIVNDLKTTGDAPLTGDKEKEFRTQFNTVKTQLLLGAENTLASPEFNKLEPSTRAQLVAGVKARLDHIENSLVNKHYGILTENENYNTAMLNRDMRTVMETNEGMRKARVISAAGPAAQQIYNMSLLDPKGVGASSAAKAMRQLDTTELIIGEAGSLNKQTKRAIEAGAKPGLEDLKSPEYLRGQVRNAVQGFVTTNDPELATKYADAMFGKENVGFLGNFDVKNRQEIYMALTTPAVEKKMQELDATHPGSYAKYKDWVVSYGFTSRVKETVSGLVEAKADPNSLAVINLTKAGYFELSVDPAKQALYDQLSNPGNDRVRGRIIDPLADVKKAVDSMNENIRIIEPILKRDGGDPAVQISKTLEAMGYKNDMAKEPTFVGKILRALRDSPEELKRQERLKNDPYGTQDTVPLGTPQTPGGKRSDAGGNTRVASLDGTSGLQSRSLGSYTDKKEAESLPAELVDHGKGTVSWGAGTSGKVVQDQRTLAEKRKLPIQPELHVAMAKSADTAGVNVQVYSGGQESSGPNRTGSHRHDHGGAGDIKLYEEGDDGKKRVLSSANPEDRKVMARFITEAVANGATGIGHGPNYMGNEGIHVGYGSDAVWADKGGKVEPWVKKAYEQGVLQRHYANGNRKRAEADTGNPPMAAA